MPGAKILGMRSSIMCYLGLHRTASDGRDGFDFCQLRLTFDSQPVGSASFRACNAAPFIQIFATMERLCRRRSTTVPLDLGPTAIAGTVSSQSSLDC